MELPTVAYFRKQAAFYRQLALEEDDEWRAEPLFLIAHDFESMAADLRCRETKREIAAAAESASLTLHQTMIRNLASSLRSFRLRLFEVGYSRFFPIPSFFTLASARFRG